MKKIENLKCNLEKSAATTALCLLTYFNLPGEQIMKRKLGKLPFMPKFSWKLFLWKTQVFIFKLNFNYTYKPKLLFLNMFSLLDFRSANKYFCTTTFIFSAITDCKTSLLFRFTVSFQTILVPEIFSLVNKTIERGTCWEVT